MSFFHRRRSMNYRRVFETPEGKRVLADLLAFCDDPRLSSPNAIVMAQMVGRMQIRQHLMRVLNYSEPAVHELLSTEQELRNREAA